MTVVPRYKVGSQEFAQHSPKEIKKTNVPAVTADRVADMSRASLDQYYIPLRSLGRGGRRKPVRTLSSSSNSRNGDFDSSLTDLVDDDDRVSTDEAPLIRKNRVCYLAVVYLIQ